MSIESTLLKFTATAAVGLFFNNICNTTATDYYDNRIKAGKTNPKVFDILHKFLPDLTEFNIASEVINLLLLSPFFLYWNTEAIHEFTSFILVIFLLRSLMINITILPKHKKCFSKNLDLTGGCYDKIFSGHFATGFLASLIFYKYNMVSNIPALVAMNTLNAIAILAVRNHYTIDIVVSIFVVIVVFNNNLKI